MTSQNFTPRVSFAPREISLLVFGAFRRTIFGGFAEERFLRESALRRDDDEKMNRRREKSFSSFPTSAIESKRIIKRKKVEKTYGWDLDVLRVGEQTL